MSRKSIDTYYMDMLKLVASRGTCLRRQVGCIITDEKGKLIATGYNGVPSGIQHCIDVPCPGAGDGPGDNSRCLAIHAEQNALLQAGSRIRFAHKLYCSCTPCFNCSKLILCTPIKIVIADETYADSTGMALLKQGKVEVFKHHGDFITHLVGDPVPVHHVHLERL